MNIDELITAARKLGLEHGKAAASWVTDGNTNRETYVKLLKGLDDGDPEVLDSLPLVPDLSGQWADGLTPVKLFDLLGASEEQVQTWECSDDLEPVLGEYEDAHSEAVTDEVERVCRLHLEDEE